MNAYRTHARAMTAAQRRLGDACPFITWDDKKVYLIPGSAHRRQDLAPGGFQLNADFKFEALVESFGYDDASALKAALLQTPLAYLGDDYKPISVGILPGGLQVSVECNSISQGA